MKRLGIVFIAAILLVPVFAQETPTLEPTITPPPTEILIPSPSPTFGEGNTPTETATLFPSATETATAFSTETATPTQDFSTETATAAETTTETPTNYVTETATTTATETTTPTASLTATSSLTPTATSTMPPMPEYPFWYADNFAVKRDDVWQYPNDWRFDHYAGRNSFYSSASAAKLQTFQSFYNVRLDLDLSLMAGEVSIGMRQTLDNGYIITVNQQGMLTLSRQYVLLTSATIPNFSTQAFHKLSILVVDQVIYVLYADSVILSYLDNQLTQSGGITIFGNLSSEFALYNVSIFTVEQAMIANSADWLMQQLAPSPAAFSAQSFMMTSHPLDGTNLVITLNSHVYNNQTTQDIFIYNPQATPVLRNITNSPSVSEDCGKISPDGKRLGYTTQRGLYVTDLYLPTTQTYTSFKVHEFFDVDHCFEWRPDSKSIAGFSITGTAYYSNVFYKTIIFNNRLLTDAIATTIFSSQAPYNYYSLAWSPDGAKLAIGNNSGEYVDNILIYNFSQGIPTTPASILLEDNNLITYSTSAIQWVTNTKLFFLQQQPGVGFNKPYHTFTINSDGTNRQLVCACMRNGSLSPLRTTQNLDYRLLEYFGLYYGTPDTLLIYADGTQSNTTTSQIQIPSITIFSDWAVVFSPPVPTTTTIPSHCAVNFANIVTQATLFSEPNASSYLFGNAAPQNVGLLARERNTPYYLSRVQRLEDNLWVDGWIEGSSLNLNACGNIGSLPETVNMVFQVVPPTATPIVFPQEACLVSLLYGYSIRAKPIDGTVTSGTDSSVFWVQGRFLNTQSPDFQVPPNFGIWYFVKNQTGKQGWVSAEAVTFDATKERECRNLWTITDSNEATPEWTPFPSWTSTPTPQPRSVAPQAQELHTKAQQFGLPLPFTLWPVVEADFFQNGYGPNGFAYLTCKDEPVATATVGQGTPTAVPEIDYCQYRQTNSIHPGVDFYTVPRESDVVALCDGIMIAGRLSSGGSASDSTGQGFSLRCFADDPVDTDGDGLRDLSNVTVIYNHINRDIEFAQLPPKYGPYPIIQKGQILGNTTAYSLADNIEAHLDLQIYFANGVETQQAIQLNPLLVLASSYARNYFENSSLPYTPPYNEWYLLGRVEDIETFFWTNPTQEPPFLYKLITYLEQFYVLGTFFTGPDCLNLPSTISNLDDYDECILDPHENDLFNIHSN